MNLDTISLVITALADTQEALGLDELCATHSVSQTAVNEAVERMQTHHTHRAIETNIAGIINHAKIDNIRLSELYASSFMGRDPDMRKVELGYIYVFDSSNTSKIFNKGGTITTSCHTNCHGNCHSNRGWR